MPDNRDEIALKFGLCKCDEAYTKRGLVAPDCPFHSMAVTEAMDEYMKECCLELLEFIAKNRVDVDCDYPEGKENFYYKGEWITKEQLFESYL